MPNHTGSKPSANITGAMMGMDVRIVAPQQRVKGHPGLTRYELVTP